ncbi:MAG TPA: hypothetical protein VNC39_14080 [Acidocella sp.]|jgi:hypothetical protein|uniref:hypothetical protein n=1 Tax=Acidocella sp. TaxID=50710 RepID=UPI002C25DD52|nr:hypothetical protein [Acidocella sp.]HVE23095.1 hypothetical protein [Acidocella sp.]
METCRRHDAERFASLEPVLRQTERALDTPGAHKQVCLASMIRRFASPRQTSRQCDLHETGGRRSPDGRSI